MPDAAARSVEYVGFWKRVFAALVDTLIFSLALFALGFALLGSHFDTLPGSGAGANFLSLLIQTVLTALVIVLFWIFRGATPGKMVISAKIVDAKTLDTPSTAQLVGRYLGYYVSILPLGLGLVWVAIDPRKQGFHDKLAGTVVVHKGVTE